MLVKDRHEAFTNDKLTLALIISLPSRAKKNMIGGQVIMVLKF